MELRNPGRQPLLRVGLRANLRLAPGFGAGGLQFHGRPATGALPVRGGPQGHREIVLSCLGL